MSDWLWMNSVLPWSKGGINYFSEVIEDHLIVYIIPAQNDVPLIELPSCVN